MDSVVKHWFVVPPLDGPASGGTVYNRELVRELSRLGVAVEALAPDAAGAALAAGAAGCFWVDSLFLEHFEALARGNVARRPLGLLAHYLPSLVEQGDGATPRSLSRAEASTLARTDLLLAPSSYMKAALMRLGFAASGRCFIVEPGCLATGTRPPPPARAGLRALLIANLTPGKGVEPFLRALAAELEPRDELQLTIVGSLEADHDCARACQRLVEAEPQLTQRVTFTGELPPSGVLALLSAGDLLISASRMESFGMAIAEARTLGVPVAARAGGNTTSLVDPAAGGTLFDGDRELARGCCELSRAPLALARVAQLARRYPRAPRSFADAAREFLDQLSSTDLAGAQ